MNNIWKPSQKELDLFTTISELENRRLKDKERIWETLHDTHLKYMYKRFVPEDLHIDYKDFVYAIYKCTEKHND